MNRLTHNRRRLDLLCLALLALVLVVLSACDSSTQVDLGPKTDARIRDGEEAKAKVETIDERTVRVPQLLTRDQIYKTRDILLSRLDQILSIGPSAVGAESEGISIFKETEVESGACSLRIQKTIFEDSEIQKFIDDLQKADRPCDQITILASRIEIGEGRTLNSEGKDLIIITDHLVLNGIISTKAITAPDNSHGLKSGALHIFALTAEIGPKAELDASGGDAGAFNPIEPSAYRDRHPAQYLIDETNRFDFPNYITSAPFGEKYTYTNLDQVPERLRRYVDSAGLSLAHFAGEALKERFKNYQEIPNDVLEQPPFVLTDGADVYDARWEIKYQEHKAKYIGPDSVPVRIPALRHEGGTLSGGGAGPIQFLLAQPAPLAIAPAFKQESGTSIDVESGEYFTRKLPREHNLTTFKLPIMNFYLIDKIQYEVSLIGINRRDRTRTKETLIHFVEFDNAHEYIIDVVAHPVHDIPSDAAPVRFEAAESPEAVGVDFGFKQNKALVEQAITIADLNVTSLPPGFAAFESWCKAWEALDLEAKRSGIHLER